MVKIIFVCLLYRGHLQIPIAIGKSLLFRDSKHDIYFVVDEEYDKKIKAECSQFKTLIFEREKFNKEQYDESRKRRLTNWFLENEDRFRYCTRSYTRLVDVWKSRQILIQNLINQVEPDLIIVENLFSLPFIMAMKYKWIQIVSTNPLKITDQINYPPETSAVSPNDNFKWFTDVLIEEGANFRNRMDEWFKECNLIRESTLCQIQPSPILNVYMYPKVFNYFEPKDINGKWLQLNHVILRDEINSFIRDQGWTNEKMIGKELITDEFLKKPGKLIFFSIGTLVSDMVEIVEKILPILGECPHKFIVSKGKNGDQFTLPANCVGANMINQLELLSICEVFVTHGGFSEACYFGIPMVIIPIMHDQMDNACRLETFKLGKKILVQNITKEALCDAIDYASSEKVIKRMKEISGIIKKEDKAIDELCDLLIKICTE